MITIFAAGAGVFLLGFIGGMLFVFWGGQKP